MQYIYFLLQYNLERKDWLSKMNIQTETSLDDNMLNNILIFPRISAKYILEIMCVHQKSLFS